MKQLVESADFVFVGVIENVIPIDHQYQEITREKLKEINDLSLFQIRVEEPLAPADWHPAESVYALVGSAWSYIDDLRKLRIGEKDIFLARKIFLPHWGQTLIPTCDYFINEPVANQAEVTKLLKPKLGITEDWNHFAWLEDCLREAETIQPGMTRKDLQALFRLVISPDGKNRKYVLSHCPYITLDVEFEIPNQEGDSDKIIRVSKPGLEWVQLG